MITIKQPIITVKNGKARLSADIDVDGLMTQLWFEKVFFKLLRLDKVAQGEFKSR